MNYLRLHLFLFSSMSLVATTVFADETSAILPEKEEDIPVEFIPTLDTTISVGFRRLNNGPRVRFGNLGSLAQMGAASSEDYQKSGENFVGHSYTDGYVVKDTAGQYEKDGTGTPLDNGGTYSNTSWTSVRDANGIVTVYQAIPIALSNVADSDGLYRPKTTTVVNPDGSISQTNVTGLASVSKFIGYNKDRARSWQTLNKSQIYKKDFGKGRGEQTYVDMHSDGVQSAGASLEAESSASSGFDISVERRLGKRGKLDWGVSTGFKFTYINAKAAGTFPAYLLRTTDSYELDVSHLKTGATISNNQYGGGNAIGLDYSDLNGAPLYKYVDSSTAPIRTVDGADASGAVPISVADGTIEWGEGPEIAGIINIHGNYQLKGAYLLAHLGPTFRYNFNDRWAISGTFGLALAWVGTNFKATEYYNTWNDVFALDGVTPLRPDLEGNTTEYHWSESNATHKFTPGLYYDLNAEYWVTDRTGFYVGLTGQNMRKYNQSKLSGRTATVEMGKTAGWTVGIRTRF